MQSLQTNNTSRYLDLDLTQSSGGRDDSKQPYLFSPCLQSSFDHGPRGKHGFLIGFDPRCDIVVLHQPGISAFHCSLTFDEGNRLILRDHSQRGTIVTYNGKGRELRRHFTWIVGGHEALGQSTKIVIEIHILLNSRLSFLIYISQHKLPSIRPECRSIPRGRGACGRPH